MPWWRRKKSIRILIVLGAVCFLGLTAMGTFYYDTYTFKNLSTSSDVTVTLVRAAVIGAGR